MRYPNALVTAITAAAVSVQANPSGWRTDGSGRYPDANPTLSWSANEHVIWKTALPSWSNASPVLAREENEVTVYVCSEPDRVIAVDGIDGSIRWQRSLGDVASVDGVKTHEATGYTSATPATDGGLVFTVFGSGVVAAHDPEGNRLWARMVQRPDNDWGHSASPVIAGGLLIVHIRNLFGLDPATGEQVWQQTSEGRFGSPAVADIEGTDVVITPSGDVFRGTDGAKLSSGIGSLQYATPVVDEGVVYFVEKKATAVRLPETLTDEGFSAAELWKSRVMGSRHYSSPVIHEGLIYAISREEKLSILDATSGRVLHERGLDLGSGSNSAYSSVTLAGDRLFVSASNGATVVLEPGRSYVELSRNKVEEFRSTAVFDADRMYIRARDYLYCIGRN